MSSSARRERFFTGRQVTTMVVVLMAVVGMPGAVWAVDAFTNVAVMDPVTGVKAQVDNFRRVQVSGPVQVLNTLTARETPLTDLKRFSTGLREECVTIAAPGAGKALVLRTLNINVSTGVPGGDLALYLGIPSDPCGGSPLQYFDDAQKGDWRAIDFGAGLAIPSGRVLGGRVHGGLAYVSAQVSAYGYQVPASALP